MHTLIEFGLFKNAAEYAVKRFRTFLVMFKSDFMAREGRIRESASPRGRSVQQGAIQEQAAGEASEADGASGDSPYPSLSDNELLEVNKKVKAYFADRVENIKDRMREKGFLTPDWERVLTSNFLSWLMDYNNPLRTGGGRVAHASTTLDVVSSVKAYSELPDTPAALVTTLQNLNAIYPDAVEALKSAGKANKSY